MYRTRSAAYVARRARWGSGDPVYLRSHRDEDLGQCERGDAMGKVGEGESAMFFFEMKEDRIHHGIFGEILSRAHSPRNSLEQGNVTLKSNFCGQLYR